MPQYKVRDNQTGGMYLINWDSAGPITPSDIERLVRAQLPPAEVMESGLKEVRGLGTNASQVPVPIQRRPGSETIIPSPADAARTAALPTQPSLVESLQGMTSAIRNAPGIRQAYDASTSPLLDLFGGDSSKLSQLEDGQPSFNARLMTEGMPGLGPVLAGLGAIKPQWQANAAEFMSRQATPAAVVAGVATLGGAVPATIANAALAGQGALQATDPAQSTAGRYAGGINAALGVLGGVHAARAAGARPMEPPSATATATFPVEGIPPVERPPTPASVAPPASQTFSAGQFSAPTPTSMNPGAAVAQESAAVRLAKQKVDLAMAEHRLAQAQATVARNAAEAAAKAAAEQQALTEIATIKAGLVEKGSGVVETYKAPNAAGGIETGKRVFGVEEAETPAAAPPVETAPVASPAPAQAPIEPPPAPPAPVVAEAPTTPARPPAIDLSEIDRIMNMPPPAGTPPVFEPNIDLPLEEGATLPLEGGPAAPPPGAPAPPAETPAPVAEPAAPVKRGRGRPKGAKTGVNVVPPTDLPALTPEQITNSAPGTPEPGSGPVPEGPSRASIRKSRADWIRDRFPDDPAKRAEAYKALGGIDAALKKGGEINVDEALTKLKELFGAGPDSEKGSAGIATALDIARYGLGAAGGAALDPQHPIRGGLTGAVLAHTAGPLARTAMRYPAPALRAAGGAAGGAYLASDQGYDPLLGGVVGGVAGAAIPYNASSREFLKSLDAARYEGMLSGSAQLTNVAGNIGSLAMSPIIDTLGGDTAAATKMIRQYLHPLDTARVGLEGLKKGWADVGAQTKFMAPVRAGDKVVGTEAVRPMGKAGRALHAVDAATKAILEKGGKTPEQARTITYSGDPVTRWGQGLAYLQSTLPGRIISPFARTAINQMELGASLSPARYFDPKLAALAPGKGIVNNALLATLSPVALLAAAPEVRRLFTDNAGTSSLGSSNQSKLALAGPLTTPLAAGKGIHDYGQYGRSGGKDMVEAVMNQVPFLSDIPRLTRDPAKLLSSVGAQPLPQAMLMLGDPQVREISSPTDAIRERIPALRETLPLRRDFSGKPLERNFLGQYPPPQYETDPFAARLSDLGILRREQSSNLGKNDALSGIEKSRLQELRGTTMRSVLEPPLMSGALDTLPDTTPTAQVISSLPPAQAATIKKVMAIMQRQNPSAAPPASKIDVIQLLKRFGIDLGTKAFDAERLGALSGDLAAGR